MGNIVAEHRAATEAVGAARVASVGSSALPNILGKGEESFNGCARRMRASWDDEQVALKELDQSINAGGQHLMSLNQLADGGVGGTGPEPPEPTPEALYLSGIKGAVALIAPFVLVAGAFS